LKQYHRFGTGLLLALFAALASGGQSASKNPSTPAATSEAKTAPSSASKTEEQGGHAELLKSAEVYIRKLFAWGPDFKLQLGPLTQSAAADFYTMPVQVTFGGHTDTGQLYISKDGKTLLRGEIFDTARDPFAADRASLHPEGNPSVGPANASVTVVIFSDFQCPHCRELHESLHNLIAKYPQVRIVYKDFPITEIHPWAETAAIGARCAYMQSPAAYWKMNDLIFDNQDIISAENVWDKLADYASQAGIDANALKACLSSPEAAKAVDGNHADGVAVSVNSTPTSFVNGRPVVGEDAQALQQFIDYELATHPK